MVRPSFRRGIFLAICFLLGALPVAEMRRFNTDFIKRHSASYGKTTHQSQEHSSPKYSANNAVDGDNTTCSKTANMKDPWWEVNLGEIINVTKIQVQNSWKHPLVIYIYVYGYDNGEDDVQTCGVKHILEGGETRWIICDPIISGYLVRIVTFGEQQSLSLCEVQVFDEKVELTKGVMYNATFNLTTESFKTVIPKADSTGVVSTFQSPRNISDHYGIYMITYYNAPESGNYTFYMSGDEKCRLFIKHSGKDAIQIGIIPASEDARRTSFDQWNGSDPKTDFLLKGKVYEMTVIMTEDTGEDYLRVGVCLPSGRCERPMKNRIFTSYEAANISIADNDESNSSEDEVLEFAIETAMNRLGNDDTVSKTKVLDELEQLGLDKARSLPLGDKVFVSSVSQKNNFVFAAIAISLDKYHGFRFPEDVGNSRFFNDGSIAFPDTVFGTNNKGRASIVCMMFEPLQVMKANTGSDKSYLGSNVISALIEPDIGKNLIEPVELVFKNTMKDSERNSQCVFWIEDKLENPGRFGRWSDEGCTLAYKNDTHTVCQCNHLTKFVILFPVQEGSSEDEFNLELITYIGLSLSTAGCFITFIVYLILRLARTLKAIVHLNLVFALGLADLAFLFGNFAENNKDACFGTTILTFFLYLAVFGWMLVEGIHLYFLVIKVFGSDDYRRKRYYYFIGWGIPVIIVIITSGILQYDLVSEYHCWLSVENGAIWAFIAPALVVIFVNTLILAAVLRTTMTVLSNDPGHSREKSAMRTLAMMLPILGVTWVFGVLTFANSSIVFQYIFAACNAFQGFFIFIFYCLFNTEVRNEYQRKVKAWKTEREIESRRSKQQSIDLYQG